MISTIILLYACPGISEFDIGTSLGVTKPAIFTAGLACLYVSTILTVVSGAQYLQAAWPILTKKEWRSRLSVMG